MFSIDQDKISARQLYVLLFLALLSPLVRALPAWTAATAGVGAWLTGLTAFPPLLLGAWVLCALLRRGEGLADVFRRVLGPVLGRALTIIYMVWALFLLCLEGRLYAERMLAAGYRGAPAAFLVVLLALAWWMARGKLSAFARAGEIFYLVLSAALGLVLLFSILDLTPEHVLPIWTQDASGILAATAVPLGTVSLGVFGAFLWGGTAPRPGDRRRGVRWLAALCAVMTLLQFGVLAQLGPGLSAQLEAPFFEVARGVGVQGAFQRVESIVVALWLMSDLALLGLLLFALRAMAGTVLGPKGARWTPHVCAILALLGGLFLFSDGEQVKNLSALLVLPVNLALGFLVPLLVLALGRLRHK